MKALKLAMIIPLALMFVGIANKVKAQGDLSEECIKNLNFYEDEYKKKDYKAALVYWREALKTCPPDRFQNLYIKGATIMRSHINTITDPAQKKGAVDTLLMMYDKRIQYFKVDKADLMFRKADIIEEYYPENKNAIYDAYYKAIDSDRDNGVLHSAAKAMIAATQLYEAKQIDADKFTDIYTSLSEIADNRIKLKINDSVALKDAKDCKAAIENAFINTDAATCENLIRLFTPRFEAHSKDIATVGMIVNMLNNRECTNNELYPRVAEAYYALDPSPKSAYTLAQMFYIKGELDKSIQYYKNAIEGQTEPTDKASYMTTLASILLKEGQTSQAMSYAKQAININSRNGKAYIILAGIYAGAKCGDDAVSRKSIFWVAVDVLQRARQVETDPKVLEDINRSINLYSQHFPSFDECFDLDILDGQTYTVSCGGINEKTKVRTRK